MATVTSEHGPSWYDVNRTLTDLKKAHQRNFCIEVNQTSPAMGYPELYVRVYCFQGYKNGATVNERGKGHQYPTREAKTVPALIYRLLLELDSELTYVKDQAEQQAGF